MIQDKVKYLMLCNLTAFVGGFCVMTVEIIAGRLIARYLGVSLYTWTSVIGVVLAGISFGNYFGGRIADRFDSKRTLSALFILSSITCAIVPSLNYFMGHTFIPLSLSWPIRIVLHVGVIFFLPSAFLGMISPVVAKFALDQGFKTGRTIGDVYAFSAIGSIVGTFIAGFFLISHIGSVAAVWIIAAVLALIGIFYEIKNRFGRLWLAMFMFLIFLSVMSIDWAQAITVKLHIKDTESKNLIYEKDSQYSDIQVRKDEKQSDVYKLSIDDLTQTSINIIDPLDLKYAYDYYETFASIVQELRPKKEKLSFLNLGGGGYLFPRYLEKHWPGSSIEVVEIDPEVTRTAQKFFQLSTVPRIQIHHMDARNFIEDLARKKARGEEALSYDFIFCDVFQGGLGVPYHLTTYEFHQMAAKLLAPEGLYVMNVVDSSMNPLFLKALVNTLDRTFPYTYVFLTHMQREKEPLEPTLSIHKTYVIVAAQREIDPRLFDKEGFNATLLDKEKLCSQAGGPRGLTLTDNYAPTDSLLADVFRRQFEMKAYLIAMGKGMELSRQGRFEQAVGRFKQALIINPDYMEANFNVAAIELMQKKYDEAIKYFNKALEADPEFEPALLGLAGALEKKGRLEDALPLYAKAIEIDPQDAETHALLGNNFLMQHKLQKALESYFRALEIDPKNEIALKNLALLGVNIRGLKQNGE